MSGRYRQRSPRSRWMPLRYAGTCKVCGAEVPAGATAFYDGAVKTITCHAIDCAEADGLTERVWWGSPISGQFVPRRRGYRIDPETGREVI